MASDNSSSSLPPPPDLAPESRPNPLRTVSRAERLWTLAILGIVGIAFGLGSFTFFYAKGFSYLSNDPAACVNCHIMREQYEGWSHSSHKAVAGCNDCHTPHRFPDKWIIKGVNGWNHSLAFTTGNFPDPIVIRGFNANIAQENCVECHATTVAQMHQFISPEELRCVDCHGNVGHNNAAPIANPRAPISTLVEFLSTEPPPEEAGSAPEVETPEAVAPETGTPDTEETE